MGEPRVKYLRTDDLGTLLLDEAHGYVITDLDLGWANPREVSETRINASGEDDSTAFFGSRAVTFTAACFATDDGLLSRREVLANLRAYASPGRRPELVFVDDDEVEQRVVLVGKGGSWPFTRAPEGVAVKLQAQWKAPDGVIESAALRTVTVGPVPPSDPGRVYPKTYSFTYPKTSGLGAQGVFNAGREAAAPIYRAWGPCTNPSIVNPDTGDVVTFGGTGVGDLVLTSSQYAELDVKNATARLNGRASDNLLRYLANPAVSFAYLGPGANRLRYVPKVYGDGAHLDVLYRDTWI